LEIQVISVLLGLFVGIIMSLTGAGGAILAVPLLMFFLDLEMHAAAPIALLAVFFGALISSAIGLVQGVVRYKAALLLAMMGMLLAPLGVVLAHHIPPLLLKVFFVAVLFYVAWNALKKQTQAQGCEISMHAYSPTPCEINPATSKLFWTAACTRRLIFTGSLAGLLSGMLGVGGGFVVVPSLRKISNIEHKSIVATSLTMIALVSLVGIFSYAGYRKITYQIAVPFVVATLAASVLGRYYANYFTVEKSKFIFGLLSLLLAFSMLFNILKLLYISI
jgi:uncharacterized membrane protein YfcA